MPSSKSVGWPADQPGERPRARLLAEYARGEEANSGSTATAALVRRDALIVANVGDSRAVLCRAGAALDLTTQHRVHGRGEAVRAETKRVQEVRAGAAGEWDGPGALCGEPPGLAAECCGRGWECDARQPAVKRE